MVRRSLFAVSLAALCGLVCWSLLGPLSLSPSSRSLDPPVRSTAPTRGTGLGARFADGGGADSEPKLRLDALRTSEQAFLDAPGSVDACDDRAAALDAAGLGHLAFEQARRCHALEPTGSGAEQRLLRLVPLAQSIARQGRQGQQGQQGQQGTDIDPLRPSLQRQARRDALVRWARQRSSPFPPSGLEIDPPAEHLDRLAEALLLHGEGLEHAADRRFPEAADSFVASAELLESLGEPWAGWSWVEAGVNAYYDQRFETSSDFLRRARAHAVPNPALLARILWIEGLIERARFRPVHAENRFEAAMEIYAELGEEDHVGFLKSNLATVAYDLGDLHRSWQLRFEAIETLDVQEPLRVFAMLGNAAEVALRTDQPWAALDFLLEAEHRLAAVPADFPHLLVQERLARLLARLRQPELAHRALERAEELLEILDEGNGMRARIETSLDHARASIAAAEGDVDLALERLAEVLDAHRRSGLGLDAADLRLERAELLRTADRPEDAAHELEAGLEALELGRTGLGPDQRALYFERTRDLFDHRLELELQRADPDPWTLLLCAERSRARTLREAHGGSHEPDLDRLRQRAAGLDPRTAVVEFAVLPERTLRFVLRGGEPTLHVLELGRAELEARISHWLEAWGEPERAEQLGSELHSLLLGPAVDNPSVDAPFVADPPIERWLIVPDGPLHRLPFSFLPVGGAPLLERAAVGSAPSLEVWLASMERPAADPLPASVLALAWGGEHPDRPELPALPLADAEARSIAEPYPAATLRLGADATVRAFLEEAPAHSVIHLAAHALADPLAGGGSRLLLAPTAEGPDTVGEPGADGELRADVLAGLDLSSVGLAVLSACSTARGGPPLRDGLVGLVGPFLGAGVPTVVASLWPVEDRPTALLMTHFHRHLRAGRAPAEALRQAQLELLSHPDPTLARPANAAAFQVFGRSF